jgi:uncharacterized membrane protein
MIKLDTVYILAGLLFVAIAGFSAVDRTNPKRLKNAVFWGLLAVSFLAGSYLGDLGNGILVLALVGLAGFGGGLGRGAGDLPPVEVREASARRWGNRLFVPALTIPAVALLGSLFLKSARFGDVPLVDPAQVTLISLALGVVVALAIAFAMFRPPVTAPVQQARRLIDTVGWAAILPQMLAALGAVFALAGVGKAVGQLASDVIPGDSRFFAVMAYTVGMAVFTMIMGNGFAAFPVMTAGIGLPLIVGHFGGNPAIMGSIGMLSGFCGTLMTPMAANFNIVPAALLELPDRNGVIKVQVPTGLLLLAANTVLMYLLVFRQ